MLVWWRAWDSISAVRHPRLASRPASCHHMVSLQTTVYSSHADTNSPLQGRPRGTCYCGTGPSRTETLPAGNSRKVYWKTDSTLAQDLSSFVWKAR